MARLPTPTTALAVAALLALPLGRPSALAVPPPTGPATPELVPAIALTLEVPAIPPGAHGDAKLGLTLALLEADLADLPGVVPRVGDLPVAPGLDHALTTPRTWILSLDPAAGTLSGTLCDPDDRCTAHRASGSTPEKLTAAFAAQLAVAMDRDPTAWRGRWAQPQSLDRYAVLVAGRSAAIGYGLRAPVAEHHERNPRRDPIARAVHIDPAMPLAQWLAGRRDGTAALALAADLAPDRVAFAAGAGRWDALDELAPLDARFIVPRAAATLAGGQLDQAAATLELLAGRHAHHPAVVEMRVALLDARGELIPDALLAEWQEIAPTDLEPVRRRLARRIGDDELAEALPLARALGTRGASVEAGALAIALSAGIGRWDLAADAASARGQDALARRLTARDQLDDLPAVVLLLADHVGTDALLVRAEALLSLHRHDEAARELNALLARHPYDPDGLRLRLALELATGDEAGATHTRLALRRVEPRALRGPSSL